jgi:ABC-2 type transport system ATP-binding protein
MKKTDQLPAIFVEDLTKTYGKQTAIDNISFTVNKGEIIGFIGPNGAGKSTTMKIITSYMAPDSGQVMINGEKVNGQTKNLKKNIGYLPENNPLYEDMAVVDYLKFCADIQGVDKKEVPQRIKSMIRLCGLNPEKHKRINELSKGYRQRVGLAQAMIHDPEILILDEPTTGLDPNQIIEIRNLIKDLGKEKTIILSSHILPEVEAICDRILIISQGKIVADNTFEAMKKEANQKEIIVIQLEWNKNTDPQKELLALSSIDEVKTMDIRNGFFEITSKPGQSSKKNIFDLCVKRKWYLLEMSNIKSSLEDVFREVTH